MLKQSLIWFVGAGSVLLCCLALVDLRASLLLDAATREAPLSAALATDELQQQLLRAERAARAWRAPAEAPALYSRALIELGDRSTVVDVRIALYCRALGALGSALERKPYAARLLLNWANLRQILGEMSCAERHAAGDYRAAARSALRSNPLDDDVLYGALLVAVRGGDKAEVLGLIQRFLSFSMANDAGREQLISNQIQNGADLEAAIPSRFPQIVRWSSLLRTQRAHDLPILTAALSRMQKAAVTEGNRALVRGEMTEDLYYDHLMSLLPVAADSAARQKIDQELSAIVTRQGDVTLGGYLARRAQYTDLKLLRSVLSSDTRPQKTPLFGWDEDQTISFDEFYRTVGFFLPEGENLKIIELRSASGGLDLSPLFIHIYGSPDNQVWTDITSNVAFNVHRFGRGALCTIQPHDVSFRYWKVHFGNSSRERRFVNSLSDLVRAYGYSRRSNNASS